MAQGAGCLVGEEEVTYALFMTQEPSTPQRYLSFLRNLEGIYPIRQVRCQLLVQLPQALLQDLKHVVSFP